MASSTATTPPLGGAKRTRTADSTDADARASKVSATQDVVADAFAAPDTMLAEELVDTLRVAPPNEQLQWHVTLVDDKNSLINAMKRVDDVMNAVGKPTATVRLTLTHFGLSINADVQQCIMLAVRHTAHAVYTQPHDPPASGAGRPERTHSVVVNVREFLTALRRHESDVVEVYRAAGRNDVVVTSRDEHTGGVNWQLVPVLEDDTVGCMLDGDDEIQVPILHHMHINAGSLKSLLDAARGADATTVTLQVHTPHAASQNGGGGTPDTLLTTTYTTCHSAATAGGYCVPLRAVAATTGGTAETLMRWGILTLKDVAGARTLTDAANSQSDGARAFVPPTKQPDDVKAASILTLDGNGSQVQGGSMPILSLEMSFGFQKLYKMLPTSGSVHLRFSENNLVVAYPSPHTQMMCIMAANLCE